MLLDVVILIAWAIVSPFHFTVIELDKVVSYHIQSLNFRH